MSKLISNNAVHLAKILCQQEIQACRRIHRDEEKSVLSGELCALLGETLKVAVACEGSERSLTSFLDDVASSDELLPREKLILDCMRKPNNGSKYLDELSTVLSYQSDVDVCATVTHNVSHILQLSGHYDMSFEAIGRFLNRFGFKKGTNLSSLEHLERAGSYFFDGDNSRCCRWGKHQYLHLPSSCVPKDGAVIYSKNKWQRLRYFFATYGSDEILKSVLSTEFGKYTGSLLVEGLRRKLDPDFLRPIIDAYINSEFFTNFSMLPLTHLPWGGEHLVLLKPLLPSEKSIMAKIKDGEDLYNTMELAAHVGEHELASRINNAAFNCAYENGFDTDVDYYFTACIAADLPLDEARRWLQEGCPTWLDVLDATRDAIEYLCCRGLDLSEAVDVIIGGDIRSEDDMRSHFIANKWANGFDVAEDIEYILNSSVAPSISKISSLQYLGTILTVDKSDGGVSFV